eukprot:g51259.t1
MWCVMLPLLVVVVVVVVTMTMMMMVMMMGRLRTELACYLAVWCLCVMLLLGSIQPAIVVELCAVLLCWLPVFFPLLLAYGVLDFVSWPAWLSLPAWCNSCFGTCLSGCVSCLSITRTSFCSLCSDLNQEEVEIEIIRSPEQQLEDRFGITLQAPGRTLELHSPSALGPADSATSSGLPRMSTSSRDNSGVANGASERQAAGSPSSAQNLASASVDNSKPNSVSKIGLIFL